MKTSNLPLNARVTIEVQDHHLNLVVHSIPLTICPGWRFTEEDLKRAAAAAMLELGGMRSTTHTAKLLRGTNGRRLDGVDSTCVRSIEGV